MSIKNDIKMVREELTSEEKFFERTVITERFLRKYKNLLIALVASIVLLVGISILYEINEESTILAANEAFNELSINPADQNALTRLEVLSPNLYDAYIYSKAIINKDLKTIENLQTSQAMIIPQLAKYESLRSQNDLEVYSLSQDAIYKDLARVQIAIFLLNSGKIEKAQAKLRLITEMSSLNKISKSLLHYGVK